MPEPTPFEDNPKFLALSPEAQDIVRKKFLSLSPTAQAIVSQKLGGGGIKAIAAEKLKPEAIDPAAAAEDLKATIPRTTLYQALTRPSPTLVEKAKAIKNPVLGGAAEFGAEMMTVQNAGLGYGLSRVPEAVARAAAGAFGVEAMKAVKQQAPEAYAAFQRGDTKEGIRLATKAGLGSILAYAGVKGALKGEPTAKVAEPTKVAEAPLDVTMDELVDLETPTVLRRPPPPPTASPPPAAPPGSVADLSLETTGPGAPKGYYETKPKPPVTAEEARAAEALQNLSLEGGDVPIPVEELPPGRGPRPAMEPTETIPQAQYPGPEPPARQPLIPEELIGQPEPAIEPSPVSAPFEGVIEPPPPGMSPTEPFIPADMSGPPPDAISVELFRQQQTLEGQQKAAKALREAIPDSESSAVLDRAAAETQQKVDALNRLAEERRAMREPPVVPNPPASWMAESMLSEELALRGVDVRNPQAVMDAVAKDFHKPARVATVGVYSTSKSSELPGSYRADLAEGKPSMVLHEAEHMKEAETGKPVPEGPGANDKITADWIRENNGVSVQLTTANKALQAVADKIEMSAREREIMLEPGQAERTLEKGTVSPEVREELREGQPKPTTKNLRISEADVKANQRMLGEMTLATRQAHAVAERLETMAGTEAGRARAREAREVAANLDKEFSKLYRQSRSLKFAAGRTVRAWSQPPPELIIEARRLGLTLENLKQEAVREPIWDDYIKAVKEYKAGKLSPGELAKRLGSDFTMDVSTNLFTLFSAIRDTAFNSTEIGTQMVQTAGMDLARVTQGKFDFPNVRSWTYAFADRFSRKPLPPLIEQMLGHKTAMGMDVRAGWRGERGMRLMRTTPLRKVADYAAGAGAYAKGAVDRAAGNLAAQATLWAEALKNTPKGLSPMERRAWQRKFVENPTTDALLKAEENGRKAKADRPLSNWEQKASASTAYRLAVDLFARWGFQAGRAIGEWFGVNPEMMKRIAKGERIPAEELGGYIAKSLTGPMGVYLVGNLLYDDMDFKGMRQVTPEGTRDLNFAPIPEMLFITAAEKAVADPENRQRHLENMKATLPFVSFPGAKLVQLLTGGEGGGFLSAIIGKIKLYGGDTTMNAEKIQREFVDQLNRNFPFQAVTSALKMILDPIQRVGIGARLPGVSEAKPMRYSTTTGEPLIRKSQLPFGAGEVALAASLPGSTTVQNPIEKLFTKYRLDEYHGPRKPLPGANDVDYAQLKESIAKAHEGKQALPEEDELYREWERELGTARKKLMWDVAVKMKYQDYDLNKVDYETGRAIVKKLDSAATNMASNSLMIRYGAEPKPFRKETMAEMTGPTAIHDQYMKAKRAREQAQAEAMRRSQAAQPR